MTVCDFCGHGKRGEIGIRSAAPYLSVGNDVDGAIEVLDLCPGCSSWLREEIARVIEAKLAARKETARDHA